MILRYCLATKEQYFCSVYLKALFWFLVWWLVFFLSVEHKSKEVNKELL